MQVVHVVATDVKDDLGFGCLDGFLEIAKLPENLWPWCLRAASKLTSRQRKKS
jgi:hypothetical protein